MSRLGGQSEARPPVFKSPSKLGTHLLTHCCEGERLSRPSQPGSYISPPAVADFSLTDKNGERYRAELLRQPHPIPSSIRASDFCSPYQGYLDKADSAPPPLFRKPQRLGHG
ncbi:hypothetical protein TNCV_1713451 [Trichonephila clavipes]|nr:hypothetical protein TNCV_1713451 [Trichonephila clavipes]